MAFGRLEIRTLSLLLLGLLVVTLFVTLSSGAKDKEHEEHEEHDEHDHEEDHDEHDEHDDHEDHDDHEEHSEHSLLRNETNPVKEVLEHFDTNKDGKISRKEFKVFYDAVFLGEDEHDQAKEEEEEEHEHEEEEKHEHKRRSFSARNLLSLEDEHDEEEHEHEEVGDCPNDEELFAQFDRDENNRLDKKELKRLLPAMLMMVVDGCVPEVEEEEHNDCKKSSTAEAWGFGILSSIIITLIAVIGIILIPLHNKTWKRYIISTLVAFAIGALVGDAILHLLPETFGAHKEHGGEEEGHEGHEEEEEEEVDSDTVLYRGMVVLATILGCYLFERMLHWCLPGGHSHGLEKDHKDHSDSEDFDEEDPGEKKKGWRKIKPFGYLNLISDGIHNFVDGLIIGFNWSVSTETGFKSTLAIGFHEIPQEFGDFGLLVKAGFTKWQAIGFNLLTAACSIIGTLIGLGVGSSVEEATPWITAVTAGFFLYIALADMVPEIMHLKGPLHIFLDFMGISVGFIVMFLLGKYAEFHGDC